MSDLSQNGWPVVPAGNVAPTTPIDGVRVRRFHLVNRKGLTIGDIWLRDGVAGFLLAYVIVFIDRWIEPVAQKQLDDWGYNVRKIANTDVWSNHASATAVDVNAVKHPQGAKGTFTLVQMIMVRRLIRQMRGAVRWGGDFHTIVDEMHWEIDTTRMFVLWQVAHKLARTRRGKRIMRSNPGLHKAVFQ